MLCFEVFVNDKKVCTAGHEELDKVITSLIYEKDKESVTLTIGGDIIGDDSIRGYAQWLILVESNGSKTKRGLKIGDEVRIIINKDIKPDKPMIYKSGKEVTKSRLKIYCSFCSKQQNEVKTMIAGPKVYICDECVDLSNEIIEYESKS